MSKTKVLALMGSPRTKKNTNDALECLLDGIDKDKCEVTRYNLLDLDIRHCTGCNYCGLREGCVQRDDMDMLYDEFDKNDIFIFATPLYFNSMTSLAKAVVDRCQIYWSLKYSLGKEYKKDKKRKGILLSIAGAPYSHDHFRGVTPIMDLFFRSIDAEYTGNYLVSHTDNLAIKDNEKVKSELKSLGENILNLKKFNIHR